MTDAQARAFLREGLEKGPRGPSRVPHVAPELSGSAFRCFGARLAQS